MKMQKMEFQLLLLPLFLAISAVSADYSPAFKPMLAAKPSLIGFSTWPLKPGAMSAAAAFKPYMVQLRSGSRLSPVAVRPASPAMLMSLKRPVKSVFSPTYSFLKQPVLKRPISLSAAAHSPFVLNLNLKPKFQSSPPGPKTGEIVYEKLKPVVTPTSGRLNINNSPKEGAIHTIPAPNLANTKSKQVHKLQISTFDDSNHLEIDIHKTTKPTFPAKSTFAPQPTFPSLPTPQPIAPFHRQFPPAGQYQVTEDHTNDATLKNPYSGMKTYFAPDPDPSLPSKTLVPTSDPLSEPSNGKYPPNDLLLHAQTQQAQISNHYLQSQSSKPYYDVVSAPSPQPGYAVPLASQPQLQQHILQQTSMLQGMPLSLYNPTYLVTQSNNLFNNHQQQLQTNLFKPESSFLGAVQNPQVAPPTGSGLFNSYSFKHTEPSAASTGQILTATQDQLQELQNAVSQIQLNDLQHQHSQDAPTYAQLVGHEQLSLHQKQIPQLNQLEQQLQQQLIQQQEKASQLTEGEIANLLNYGTINLHNQLSPNDYYHYQVDADQNQQQLYSNHQPQQQQSFYELSERQKENDLILAQAQQDLYQHQHTHTYQPNTEVTQEPQTTQTAATTDYLYAYQQHQQAVADALALGNDGIQNSKRATAEPETTQTSPLRIFVPDQDTEYPNSVKAQKRMDELNYDYADDEEAANLFNTEPNVDAVAPARYGSINRADFDEEPEDGEESTVDEPISREGETDEQPKEDFFYHNYSNHRLE